MSLCPPCARRQITSWGVVHYAFPVLSARVTADTGWSAIATTAAFSGALLVSALAGIPADRILDERGPRAVMTTGSLLGVGAVLHPQHQLPCHSSWRGMRTDDCAVVDRYPSEASVLAWIGARRG